jgi:hypothetical protein
LIYLDTSVALAHLLGEDRAPPSTLWRERLASSQLLEYELWNRLHRQSLAGSHAEAAKALLIFVSLIDLAPQVLARALQPFPKPVGTLDGLHLATVEFLRARGEEIELASYDRRLIACAQALGIAIYAL